MIVEKSSDGNVVQLLYSVSASNTSKASLGVTARLEHRQVETRREILAPTRPFSCAVASLRLMQSALRMTCFARSRTYDARYIYFY